MLTRSKELLRNRSLFTLLLLMDDFMPLHEEILPDYIGIPENILFAAYGVCALLYLFYFRDSILRSNYLILLAALVFFGFSMILDTLDDWGLIQIRGERLLEDGAKFFGIVTWLSYFLTVSLECITRLFKETAPR